jgi:hypothetical protein
VAATLPFGFGQTTGRDITFESGVLPIFQANCVPCHGSQVKMQQLDLSTFEAVMKGGESGRVITPGKPQESRLVELVEKGAMPKGGKPLPADKIAVIRAWIEAGAPSASKSAHAASESVTEDDVMPILLLRCTPCHGLRRQEGGLALDTRAGMR